VPDARERASCVHKAFCIFVVGFDGKRLYSARALLGFIDCMSMLTCAYMRVREVWLCATRAVHKRMTVLE
jgi:hypothetical protein